MGDGLGYECENSTITLYFKALAPSKKNLTKSVMELDTHILVGRFLNKLFWILIPSVFLWRYRAFVWRVLLLVCS